MSSARRESTPESAERILDTEWIKNGGIWYYYNNSQHFSIFQQIGPATAVGILYLDVNSNNTVDRRKKIGCSCRSKLRFGIISVNGSQYFTDLLYYYFEVMIVFFNKKNIWHPRHELEYWFRTNLFDTLKILQYFCDCTQSSTMVQQSILLYKRNISSDSLKWVEKEREVLQNITRTWGGYRSCSAR